MGHRNTGGPIAEIQGIVGPQAVAGPMPLVDNSMVFSQRQESLRLENLLENERDFFHCRALHAAPIRPREGQIVVADGTDWDPGSGAGVYVYLGGGYKLMSAGDTWDDLQFPATQVRQGALLKPDFDYTNVGLLFPQNDADEKIYMIGQLPHGYKPGSSIVPHVHWDQTGATFPTWVLEYKWYNNGIAVPASWTTLTANTGKFTYTSGTLSQITSFTAIVGTGMTESSVLRMIFYRNDNTVSGDVRLVEFDVHFQRNKPGTFLEYPT